MLLILFFLIFKIVEFFDVVFIYILNVLILALVSKFLGKQRHVLVAMYQCVFSSNGLQFVAFSVELAPKNIFQFVKSKACNCRDEHDRQVFWQCFT